MPTERSAVFLFAHQDDEFGVYPLLDEYRRRGVHVRCAYFTDGAANGVTAATRNAESVAVLAKLGVAPDDIVFAGELLGIADAALPRKLAVATEWLRGWIGEPDALHVPCWEGGHHDHDALHALAVQVAHERGLLERTTQYALYNGARTPAPFFRTMSPLPENGPVRATRISWPMRWRCLGYCLSYPSQRRTWIGLFPFALWFYVTRGVQSLQAVSLERTHRRPHEGALYYELRKFYTWDKMQADLASWRAGFKDTVA